MAIWRVTVFLILAIAFQAMCQDCGEVGNIGDDNAVSVDKVFCIQASCLHRILRNSFDLLLVGMSSARIRN